jgi:hypothetical protein
MRITFEFATQDDCLDKMVPSDLRVLVAQRDRLQERIEALEGMIKVFRGCIDTQILPTQGSPCHKMVWELMGAPDQSGDKE